MLTNKLIMEKNKDKRVQIKIKLIKNLNIRNASKQVDVGQNTKKKRNKKLKNQEEIVKPMKRINFKLWHLYGNIKISS